MVFQYPIIAIACAIATDVTESIGVFCQYETSIHHAKLWVCTLPLIVVHMLIIVRLASSKTSPSSQPSWPFSWSP